MNLPEHDEGVPALPYTFWFFTHSHLKNHYLTTIYTSWLEFWITQSLKNTEQRKKSSNWTSSRKKTIFSRLRIAHTHRTSTPISSLVILPSPHISAATPTIYPPNTLFHTVFWRISISLTQASIISRSFLLTTLWNNHELPQQPTNVSPTMTTN